MTSETVDEMFELSLVMPVRFEPADPDAARRVRLSLAAWKAAFDRQRLKTEILLVVWNPDHGFAELGPLLKELATPTLCCQVRVIVVPNEIHRQLPHADQLALFAHVALNAGIERARGKFILASRADILPTEELEAFLGQRQLSLKTLYRCDRLDVRLDGTFENPLQALAEQGDRAVCKVLGRRECFDLVHGTSDLTSVRVPSDIWLDMLLGFLRLSVAFLAESGFVFAKVWDVLSRPGHVALKPRLKTALSLFLSPFRNIGLLARDSLRLFHERRRARAYFLSVHANGAEDFLLMDRGSWHELRGLPEYPGSDAHVAAILLMTLAMTNKCRLQNLCQPKAVIKILPPGEPDASVMAARQLTYLQAAGIASSFAGDTGFTSFNGEGWGLGAIQLPELV